jgi:hypothetical protein
MFKKGIVLWPLLLVTSAHASDVPKEISDLRETALYAELYLLGNEFSTNHDLGQVDVIRSGCHYKTTSQEELSSLLDVVADSQVQQVPPVKWGLDVRIVLRIYTDPTHHIAFVMGQDYANAPARGRFFAADADAVTAIPPSAPFIEAKNGMQKSLRFWGIQHPELAVKPCNQ